MGPVYDGLMHFLMSPEDLAPVLALALDWLGYAVQRTDAALFSRFPSRGYLAGLCPSRGCSSFAMIPVQPVWWDAPTPLPMSPSKYSWKGM